jgi:uncharacterized membrane protein HdeD (DUF308 family)
MARSENSSNHTGLNILLGVALIIIGLFVLGAQFYTTLFSIYLLGWALIIGGVLEVIFGFFSGRGVGGIILNVLGGILNLVIGLLLIYNPVISSVTLTLIIAFTLMAVGVFRIIGNLFNRGYNWGWGLAFGIVAFLLGLMIYTHWPISGLVVLGMAIGVALLMTGALIIIHSGLFEGHSESIEAPSGTVTYASDVKAKSKEANE